MNKKHLFILFFLILFIGAFLRLYKITDVPPGVNRDEASIGYTAYSLIKTGKDEYGRSFPLSFQSFGDWKLPLYIYTVVTTVKLFGLNEFAVRIPSAIFGIITIALTFFLIQKLFNNYKLSFLTMFLLAISPWHIHLSRVESESNTAVLFVVAGTLCFLNSLGKRRWLMIPSFIFFALTYFTYAGNYVFTTLFVLALIIIYRKKLLKNRTFYISLAIFLLLSGFVLSKTLFANNTKVSGIGIFGDPTFVYLQLGIPRTQHGNNLIAEAIHNKVVYGAEVFSHNYLRSFSPQFLFIQGGGNSAHNIPNFGNMYLVESVFFYIGIVCLLFKNKTKEKYLVLCWLFLSPIAASITKDAPHTNRMLAVFPMVPLMTAFGLIFILSKVRHKVIFTIFICFLFVINFIIYMDRYYVHFPIEKAEDWGLVYKELYKSLSEKKYTLKKVVIDNPESSPYIFLLFYSKYDPATYQKEAKRYPVTPDGFVHVKSFGKYEFKNIFWEKDLDSLNTIFIGFSDKVPYNIRVTYPAFDIAPFKKSEITVVEPR